MESSSKPYILFVDDEEMTRKTFERIAGKEFEVLTADSVASAKTLLDTHAENIGVLLSDQRMPGQLGVELLEYTRNEHPWIVRMLTTAYSDLADAIAAVNRGEIIRYIEKPWNNIDALMIDLRVAMRFHMLERENSKLLEEKLSAGAAISRLDRVRSLIGIAATQAQNPHRLTAVERMLKDLSYLDCIQHSIDATNIADMEMFGQPVSDTEAAIGVADALLIFAENSTAENWNDVLSIIQKAGGSIRVNASGNPAEDELSYWSAIASGVVAAFSPTDGGNLSASVEESAQGEWLLKLESNGEDSSFVADWLSGVTIDEANVAIAGLLKLYLTASELGGGVNLGIEGNRIRVVEVVAPVRKSDNPGASEAPESGWIDDILLLYS